MASTLQYTRLDLRAAGALMTSVQTGGPLVIVGGAEDKKNDCLILKEFLRLAGGADARIVVMTVATELPEEVGEEYQRVFDGLIGRSEKGQVVPLHVKSRAEANQKASAEVIGRATGVFFTGGDQYRITSLLGGTRIDTELHRRHETGMVLGGTSAGASMMSSTMIIEGSAETTPRIGMVRLGAGMEFMPGVIIDQHFGQRGRIHRLLSAVAQYPHHLGIGIDENTALVVNGYKFEVLGGGAVTIVDAGGVSTNNLLELEHGDNLALCNVKLHILPAGYCFDLRNRTPVITGRDELKSESEKE